LQLQFLVDSGMIASENAHAYDCDRDRVVRWQRSSRWAGCRKEL
jgi:hypothetical protein